MIGAVLKLCRVCRTNSNRVEHARTMLSISLCMTSGGTLRAEHGRQSKGQALPGIADARNLADLAELVELLAAEVDSRTKPSK